MSAYNSKLPVFRTQLTKHKPRFYYEKVTDLSTDLLIDRRLKYMFRLKKYGMEKSGLTWRAIHILTEIICKRKGI